MSQGRSWRRKRRVTALTVQLVEAAGDGGGGKSVVELAAEEAAQLVVELDVEEAARLMVEKAAQLPPSLN